MSQLSTETKRILIDRFGYDDTKAHWMAFNNQPRDAQAEADLKLARQQALANLERLS